ncbi:hypothetical protein MYU51_010223 [Penicillium brevicompactum]
MDISISILTNALPVQWREWAEGMIKAVGENPTYQIQMQAHFLWFLLLSGLAPAASLMPHLLPLSSSPAVPMSASVAKSTQDHRG